MSPPREGHRRRFSEADKRRIVDAAAQPGASVAEVARRYRIDRRVLCRLRQESALPVFVTVQKGPKKPKRGSPAHRTRPQEPSVRGLRRRRLTLGHGVLAHHHRQAERHRALCLPQRCAGPHDPRPSHEPARRARALEMGSKTRQSLNRCNATTLTKF